MRPWTRSKASGAGRDATTHTLRRTLHTLLTAACLPLAAQAQLLAPGPKLELAAAPSPTAIAPIQAPGQAVAQLDALDRVARDRQLDQLAAAPTSTGPTLFMSIAASSARAAWQTAEADVDRARALAWAGMQPGYSLATLIHAPLALAFLDLQIELRRNVGPTLTTDVEGLDAEPACAGDVVGDRLIAAYGEAIVQPLGADAEATGAALESLAVQVACLGSAQLARLDRGLAKGFVDVAARMADHGLGQLEPSFAQLVAPLEVLLLDARKHRGKRASAWRWFDLHAEPLLAATANAGWATEELLVWDRRHGMLLGFPACSGSTSADCVDLEILLESVADPRALGLGGCGLAAMISQGVQAIDGDPRYVCPMQACSAPGGPGGVGATSPFGNASLAGGASLALGGLATSPHLSGSAGTGGLPGDLAAIWGNALDGQDVAAMGAICGAGGDWQGPRFDVTSCFESLPSPEAQNPFDQHMACMQEVLDPERPALGETLRGVPNGPECGLAEGGAAGADPDKKAEEPKPKEPEVAKPVDGATPKITPTPYARPLAEGNSYEITSGQGSIRAVEIVDAQTGELVRVEVSVEGMSPEQAIAAVEREIYAKDGTMQDLQFSDTAELIDIALWDAADKQSATDPKCAKGCSGRTQTLTPPAAGNQGCFDPLSCSDDGCSGIGEQISAATDCEEALLDDLAEAAGLGRPGPDEVDPTQPSDPVSNWGPDSDHGVDGSGVGLCLSAGYLPRPPAHCAFILCAGGGMAVPLGDGCGCPSSPRMTVEDVCIEAICMDGTVPGPNCECGGFDGELPDWPIGPDPVTQR
ncbi:MAG: hypothetical protein R3F35_08575 [Myxococcota bacterium]